MDKFFHRCLDLVERESAVVWKNLHTNNLWRHVCKNVLCSTIMIIIALFPEMTAAYGKAMYLGVITTVFGHPGRRFGMMAETLILSLIGALLGCAWSIFGIYLSSFMYAENPAAAYTIKGIFFVLALLFHGFVRSHTPRLFISVFLLIIVCVVNLTGVAVEVSQKSATAVMYPVLTAMGIILMTNVLIWPELSSDFLGGTTIETLGATVGVLRDTGKYFIAHGRAEDDGCEDDPADTQQLDRAMTAAELAPVSSRKAPGVYTSVFQRMVGMLYRLRNPNATPAAPSPVPKRIIKLKDLINEKAKIRAKLATCKAVQQECNFELAYAVLPPRDLKTISNNSMQHLVNNTIALIGSCESIWFLMGDGPQVPARKAKVSEELSEPQTPVVDDSEGGEGGVSSSAVTPPEDFTPDSTPKSKIPKKNPKHKKGHSRSKSRGRSRVDIDTENLELIKPRREIEFGDVELLQELLSRISDPINALQAKIDRTVDVISSCMAYAYDVPKLPSGAKAPKGIELQEIDIRTDILTEAIAEFDKTSAAALEGLAGLNEINAQQIDIMPRMETFLISSFLLNFRLAAMNLLQMLKHSRALVEKRQARHGRKRIYAPRINWRKWLSSGGEQDGNAIPEDARQEKRTGNQTDAEDDVDSDDDNDEATLDSRALDEETTGPAFTPKPLRRTNTRMPVPEPKPVEGTLIDRLRHKAANWTEYFHSSDDITYAFKITVAVILVTWPSFVAKWNTWFSLNRGLWAALQLVLITEVALGTSIQTFIYRGIGTVVGCVWGYAAYSARDGNRVVCVVMLVIGLFPSSYLQLGTKYVKVGMVVIISEAVVALATIDHTVPGSASENFLKRLIAFMIGGVVALVVEIMIFPSKARTCLVESLAASIHQISEMEACVAYGIEKEINIDVNSPQISQRFDHAKAKAQAALRAAATFLPACEKEPRLKGSFKGLALIYTEILYVLHQIVDRMDNMLQLRKEYGSGVLEELNAQIYQYRRNVAASITLILFAVHEALTTKLPLPQFLPSARLAHLRMVNRVREVVLAGEMRTGANGGVDTPTCSRSRGYPGLEESLVKRIVRQKFLSWNAASAGQIEVIEYLEELIDLTKLLVGAQEFRSGMLTRPTYRDYVDRIGKEASELAKIHPVEHQENSPPGEEAEKAIMADGIPSRPPPRILGLANRKSAIIRTEEKQKVEEEPKNPAVEEELPRSLQRVRTRRLEKEWSHQH